MRATASECGRNAFAREGRLTFRAVLTAALIGVGATGCTSETPATQDAPIHVDPAIAVTTGLGAAEQFMETWNTRDPERWASSLNFPHARFDFTVGIVASTPSAGRHRVSPTRDDYIAGVDYARVIATGWDHTEFEDLRVIHDGDTKAHVAGRWVRLDAAGNAIGRNLVSYIATEVGGQWGIQARFGAGRPLPEDQGRSIADVAVAKVEESMTAFNARDPIAWAATFNYPHVRIASGEVGVWETEEEFAAWIDFDAFAGRDWDHSEWNEIEAIQVAENGANVALTFSRYNADDEVISTFNTLYLVTNENGRWGIRARSSFAP